MNNDDWQDLSLLDDIDKQGELERNRKASGKAHKRKWREIEVIKEQRRLQRDLAAFEQCWH